MDNSYSTTNKWKKRQHLSREDRILIQIRRKDGKRIREIAREIGCAPATIANELKQGTVILYNGTVRRYKASVGQKTYEEHRQSNCRHYDYLKKDDYLQYVVKHFFEDGWSLDACFGKTLKEGAFIHEQMMNTRILYHYVDLVLLRIKNYNLTEKLKCNTRKHRNRMNRRNLGRNIEERPESINSR